MGKKRLKEIKHFVDLIKYIPRDDRGMGEMDVINVQEDMKWLIERVQELEEELYGNDIQMGYKHMYGACNRDYAKLLQQNKRYREAIKKGIKATRYTNPGVAYILAGALEGEEWLIKNGWKR